jgi:hypothetical protein
MRRKADAALGSKRFKTADPQHACPAGNTYKLGNRLKIRQLRFKPF